MKFIKSYLPLIVVLVCLTKIATAQEFTLASSLALFVAVAAYGFHGYLETREDNRWNKLSRELLDESEFQQKRHNHLRNEIDLIRSEVLAFKPIQDQVAKSAEDIKKVISTTNLGSAIYQRTRLKREPMA